MAKGKCNIICKQRAFTPLESKILSSFRSKEVALRAVVNQAQPEPYKHAQYFVDVEPLRA